MPARPTCCSRPPTRPGRPTTATAATACTSIRPGTQPGRAYKVSYNRPFTTRGTSGSDHDCVFNAEYPMVRWLEANGYNVSYITGVDTDRRGAARIQQHKVVPVGRPRRVLVGPQRANVEAARDAGVNLAFFSGNEMFWKTRWENSIDGSSTPYRTLVTLQGDARQREDRSATADLDRHAGAIRASARRPTAAGPRTR